MTSFSLSLDQHIFFFLQKKQQTLALKEIIQGKFSKQEYSENIGIFFPQS